MRCHSQLSQGLALPPGLSTADLPGNLADLVVQAHHGTSQRVVVLIDEYDKPISVYNPFGLLLFFDQRAIHPYWFETGTPTFLIKLLAQRQQFTPDLSRIVATDTLLSTFDVDQMPVEALMFQAGYLTIDHVWHIPGQLEITLNYPNLEVRSSLNRSLLQSRTHSLTVPGPHISKLYKLLMAQDLAGLKDLFHAFYASIANDGYRKNELSHYEGYYVSIFYSYFAALGLNIRLEDPTNHGRIDRRCCSTHRYFCSSSKWSKSARQGRRWRRSRPCTTPTNTAAAASPYT